MSKLEHMIRISKWTKDILDEFKKVEGHTSYDSVLKSLITRSMVEKSYAFDKQTGRTDMTETKYRNAQLIMYEKTTEQDLEDWKERLKKRIRGER